MMITGDRTRIAQLLSVRSALRLEAAGMQSRRALRPMWADRLGLKKRDSHAVFISRITELIEKFNEDPAALHDWCETFNKENA